MKRLFVLFVVVVLICSAWTNVVADLISTPDDEFFRDHEDEISVWGYWHQAERDIAVVEYPGSDHIVGVIEKDRVIRVLHLYEDEHGVLWGAQNIGDDDSIWFKMKYLPKFYSNFEFWQEYQSEFKTPNRKVQIYFEEDAWLVVWEYPGSDHISGTLPTSITRDTQYPLYEGSEYFDNKGNRWTSISHRGVSGWLNMEAMISETEPEVESIWITLDENFDPSKYDFSESVFDLYGKELLIGTLVISVCVFTGVLTIIKKKRVKTK